MSHTDFDLVQERHLSEVDGLARLYRHKATGAQVLSIVNSDENKCFGVTFRTPPKNSTGVAHILEHSVLCGSQKYPVKEPFLVLLQGSLQSFLNAFTYPDKTCYPVASANLQDFYNLIDVYIDAVLHPNISEDTLRQEGWHIEAEDADGPWQFKGVVFNEMKGVYSSPESRLAEISQHSMFPDTLYSLDSGGDPAKITDLTYAEFKAFHEQYYHPSNGRFFFWGDDPEETRLEIIAKALAGYSKCDVDSTIPLQQPLAQPRRITMPYAVHEEGAKYMFTMNWLIGQRGDLKLAMLMEMLEYILEGMPGSPLRKSLISSELGEDICGCGLETDLIQMYYSLGLKGINKEDIPHAEMLMQETLAALAREGLDKELVAAAVNSVEFAYRESNFGNFPRGLAVMLQALSTWLYDHDPMEAMAWEKPLQEIKASLAQGEPIFEECIRTYFLNNPSRTTVILEPDANLAERVHQEEQARVEAIRAQLDEGGRAALCEISKKLQEAQARPDSPEALATIPNLSVADLPRENAIIPREEQQYKECMLLTHNLPTRGIAYLNMLIPLPAIAEQLLPLLSFFTRTLTDIGTSKHDYTSLGALIAAKTGGLDFSLFKSVGSEGEVKCFLNLRAKALESQIDALFDILEEIFHYPVTDQYFISKRLREMLLADKARLEQAFVVSGHAEASLRIQSQFTIDAAISETTAGFDYLNYIRPILADYNGHIGELMADLSLLHSMCTSARPGIVDCVASPQACEKIMGRISRLYYSLPRAATVSGIQKAPLRAQCVAEVLTTPSQVNYVAKGCNLKQLGFTHTGAMSVILRHISRSYLWDKVRVLGGAYGASCSLGRLSGNFVCSSYRDPNVEQTLQAYDAIADYLATTKINDGELTRAIVGAIGDLDSYQLPDAKGRTSLLQYVCNDSDEKRAQLREEMLATTKQDFTDFAEVMAQAAKAGRICVIGGAKAAQVANEKGWQTTSLFASEND